jgi:hypothetical protein
LYYVQCPHPDHVDSQITGKRVFALMTLRQNACSGISPLATGQTASVIHIPSYSPPGLLAQTERKNSFIAFHTANSYHLVSIISHHDNLAELMLDVVDHDAIGRRADHL